MLEMKGAMLRRTGLSVSVSVSLTASSVEVPLVPLSIGEAVCGVWTIVPAQMWMLSSRARSW